MYSCPPTRSSRPTRAFALVLALLLLSGVALAVTGLGLLTRVELQTGGARDDAARARRQALVALDLALEHLQREAGPDARVTARAEIGGAAVGSGGLLTGVWESVEGDVRLRTWLVSGNDAENPLAVGPEHLRSDPGEDHLILIGAGTAAPPARRVAAPLQPLRLPAEPANGVGTAGVEGRYAYWIGDEGLKASFALGAGPTMPDADLRGAVTTASGSFVLGDDWTGEAFPLRPRLREAVVGPSLSMAFPAMPAPDDPLRAALRPRLERVLIPAQMPFVDPSVGRLPARANAETFTPLSRAVLVNLHDAPARLRFDGTAPPVPGAAVIDGFLRTRPQVGGDGAYLVRRSPGSFAVAPVPTEAAVRIGFRADPTTGALRLEADVEVEWWNPYAAPLVTTPEGEAALRVEGVPEVWVRTAGGGERHPAPLRSRLVLAPGIRWEPGEVRILRGGEILAPDGAPAHRLTGLSFPVAPGAPVEVSVVEVPIGEPFGVRLEVGGEAEPGLISRSGYDAAAVDASSGPLRPAWAFVLGVEASRDLRDWTDGARPGARDPRDRSGGDLPVEEPGLRWPRNPAGSAGTLPRDGGGFCAELRLPRFDLPVQEPQSVGFLQHAPLGRLRGVGNPWGGDANAWLDRLVFSAAPPGEAAAGKGGNPLLEPRPLAARRTPPGLGADPAGAGVRLLLRGAFNLHSTSEAAWNAVLDRGAYWRFPHTAGDPAGPRQLGVEERRRFAAEIVAALQRRGRPFASLSAFASSGLLAGAVEAAGINSSIPSSRAGEPGWLEQADVLGALAPVLVPRSDTFLVRAGAETRSGGPDGEPTRAWCEALVQRVPDLWAEPGAPPASEADTRQPDPARHPRGRRFHVVFFRWLSEADL